MPTSKWYGVELDVGPYLEEKQQQGLVWNSSEGLFPVSFHPGGRPHKVVPMFYFDTHAGTFYNVLLPQIRQSKQTQVLGCEIHTKRWNEARDGFEFCEPYIRRDLPDHTVMRVNIRLKHPRQ